MIGKFPNIVTSIDTEAYTQMAITRYIWCKDFVEEYQMLYILGDRDIQALDA